MHLLKNRIYSGAQLTGAEHARTGLRKVRRKIVTGHVDQAPHVVVAIVEHGDHAAVNDLFACDAYARAQQPHPWMEPQRGHRELFDERDKDVAALDVDELVANHRALERRSERVETGRKRDSRSNPAERPGTAAAGLLEVTRNHREIALNLEGHSGRGDR